MKGSFRLCFAALVALLMMSEVNAALVDNGSFTTDDASDLDWLDLTATAGMRTPDALAINAGWRYASNDEIDNLFGIMFPGFNATNQYGTSRTDEGAYANQVNDAVAFHGLFGTTQIGPDSWSAGLYQDEDNIWRMMGSVFSQDFHNLAGIEHIPDYGDTALNNPSPVLGTYLVRASVVPIPATVWLLGSALGLLGWIRSRTGLVD